MNIYDCFMYFDEDMLLDLRLNVFNDHVKKFVITEATYTHNGSKKKLNFDINNYKKFRDKINYIVVDKQPPTLIDLKHDDNIEDRGKKLILNCKKISKEETLGLENSGTTSNKILDIYKKLKVSRKIKMSSSLKFCILAAGEADVYATEARAYEWDIAAGHAILSHAGGSVTTHEGEEFLYGKKNYKNLPLIAKRSSDLKL